ncbi:MAG: MFS transporter [Candidatus Thermoplasmatota archaeon]|nr:MFS transporter [Candidatus Thermoplasmatota archaeon]
MVEPHDNSDLLRALDQARTGKFHIKTLFTAGMGFFSDAYDLFVTSTAIPIIVAVFNITAGHNIFGRSMIGPVSAASVETGMIGSVALFGAFVGALIFGRIADLKGRKYIYGLEMSILVVFAIVSALSTSVTMLIISRFILGIGVGGDYPVSSTIMSEFSNVRNRGKMVLSVFAMQGFGLLFGTLIGLVAIHFLPLDYAWRFMLGFGAVPAGSVIYLRRRIKESPRYSLEVGDTRRAAMAVEAATGKPVRISGKNTESRRMTPSQFIRRYWIILIGTAGSWFLFDMAFYGTSINSGQILNEIGYGAVAGNLRSTIFNIALGNAILAGMFAVPGYWIAVSLVDRVGRKKLQWIGFTAMAIIYFTFALKYVSITKDLTLFVALYGMSYLFGNIGPNSTTFLLPTELFPTEFRTTGHGISASSGKLGAGIFTFLIPVIETLYGLQTVLGTLTVIAALGALLTVLTISETKNRSLEQTSQAIAVTEKMINPGSKQS